MGGRVGLKGTDGMLEEALKRGAEPVAPSRAARTLERLRALLQETDPHPVLDWVCAGGAMGADALSAAGFETADTVYMPAGETGRDDTLAAVRALVAAGAGLILFCGGDGTARDVVSVTGRDTPVLGIPSGVKMFSGVFGTTPEHTADILAEWLAGRLTLADAEVLDLDEEKYRHGEWSSRTYATARTPFEPVLTQASKSLIAGTSEADAKRDIAKFLFEEYRDRPGLLLLGAGSTVEAVGHAFGIEKTLLGIDAVANGRQVGKDLNEAGILALLEKWPEPRLVLSPIGAQGFVLGRGTQQISPRIVRAVGRDGLIVVSTPAKLAATPTLRFDSGDPILDAELRGDGYLPVVTGYRFSKRVKVAA